MQTDGESGRKNDHAAGRIAGVPGLYAEIV